MTKPVRIAITVLGGWFGLHKYLDGNIKIGLLYTFTGGLLAIGWIHDIIKACTSGQNRTRFKATTNTENILFQNEFLIVGEKYECRKNSKKMRADVIKKTRLNTPVHIEKYIYNGKPAYMIVNTIIGLDLGVLSARAADWLTDYYIDGTTVDAVLIDKYNASFHVQVTVRNR